MAKSTENRPRKEPWNKGKLVGQKPPLKLKEIWAIRIRLHIAKRLRDAALFNLAIDSKLRACDLVRLRVCDVVHGGQVASRAMVLQQKTNRPVQFELTEQTRESLSTWIENAQIRSDQHLFPSRLHVRLIFRRANMRESWHLGCSRLDLIQQPTERTQCAEPRQR